MKAIAGRAERRLLDKEGEEDKGEALAADLPRDPNFGVSTEDELDTVFEEVERHLRNHAYDAAKLLLIRQRLKAEGGPDVEIIDQALKVIESAEDRYRAEEGKRLEREKATLEMARALIDEEAYEKALMTLEGLDEDTAFQSEKEEIKRIAIEKLINRERNRAAKIFLKAKKSDDPAQKKEFLLTSYNILKVLVDKYPSSPYIYKINRNIETVKQALKELEKN
jgi:hypothetical protein